LGYGLHRAVRVPIMKYINHNRGSATILCLLISAVIITVGIGFNWLVKEHVGAAEALKNKTEAMLEAHSTYETLMYSVLSGVVTQNGVLLFKGSDLLGVASIPLNSTKVPVKKTITVKMQDSNGLISLLSFNKDVFRRLIKRWSTDQKAAMIVDSILDWIDPDKLSRINGAEEQFYRAEGKPYVPRNYPLQYKEEISLVRGMDYTLFTTLSPYVTMLPSTGFNPNTAPDEILMAYLDIGTETLQNLKGYMTNRVISSDVEMFSITGKQIVFDEGTYFFPSRFWEVTIEAGGLRPLYTLHAGIDITNGVRSPYEIIYWKEE
jgi:general secretion pathway protein K